MHDIIDLERRGLPGVFLASSEFVDAAEAQALALGFPPFRRRGRQVPLVDRTAWASLSA